VKDLRIEPLPHYLNNYRISVSPWRTLISRARIAPLLPNLRSLKLQKIPESYGQIQLMWITAFASPSLRSVEAGYAETAPDGAQLSFATMSLIMKVLVERCPQVETLALFPGAVQKANSTRMIEEEDDGEHSTLALVCDRPFHHYLANAQNLLSLTANTTLINPKPLEILSQLPLLESLDIFPLSQGHTPTGVLPVTLPDSAFPALRSLNVRLLPAGCLSALWSIDQMVRNLTRLGLYADFYSQEPRLFTMEWLSDFFAIVCDQSPHITDLTISLDQLQIDEIPPRTAEFRLFENMAKLPLERLYLHCLASKAADSRLLCERLGRFWPKLTWLRIPDQPVRVDELRYFAALPHLRYLSVDLQCPVGWSPLALPELGSQMLVSSSLHTLEQEKCASNLIWEDHLKPIAR
jgi:hypothetical protein